MSTSDPNLLVLNAVHPREEAAEVSSHSTLPNGTPDTGFIARIANELFAALPGSLECSIECQCLQTQRRKLSPPSLVSSSCAPRHSRSRRFRLPTDKHFSNVAGRASVQLPGSSCFSTLSSQHRHAVPGAFGSHRTGRATESTRPVFVFAGCSSSRQRSEQSAHEELFPILRLLSRATAAVPQSALQSGDSAFGVNLLDARQPTPTTQPSVVPRCPAASLSLCDRASRRLPVFSFLEELRPLFSDLTVSPGSMPDTSGHELDYIASFDLRLLDDFRRSSDIAEIADRGSFAFFEGSRARWNWKEPGRDISSLTASTRMYRATSDLNAYPFDAEAIKRRLSDSAEAGQRADLWYGSTMPPPPRSRKVLSIA